MKIAGHSFDQIIGREDLALPIENQRRKADDGECFTAARSLADAGFRVAVTEMDRMIGRLFKSTCDILLYPTLENLNSWDEVRSEFERLGGSGWVDYGFRGVALAMLGRISEGIQALKQLIIQYDKNGFSFRAICARVYLAEIYIQILSSKQKPSAAVLFRNLRRLLEQWRSDSDARGRFSWRRREPRC